MYNLLIEIFSGLLNIYGTIKTVMTVINIDFKNLSIEGTINKISHPELNAFANRKNALNGIAIIIIGFILGIIEKVYVFDILSLIVTLLIVAIMMYLIRIYYYMQYIFMIQEFDKYLIRNNKPSVIDNIKNGEEIRAIKVPIKFNVNKYIKRLE